MMADFREIEFEESLIVILEKAAHEIAELLAGPGGRHLEPIAQGRFGDWCDRVGIMSAWADLSEDLLDNGPRRLKRIAERTSHLGVDNVT